MVRCPVFRCARGAKGRRGTIKICRSFSAQSEMVGFPGPVLLFPRKVTGYEHKAGKQRHQEKNERCEDVIPVQIRICFVGTFTVGVIDISPNLAAEMPHDSKA